VPTCVALNKEGTLSFHPLDSTNAAHAPLKPFWHCNRDRDREGNGTSFTPFSLIGGTEENSPKQHVLVNGLNGMNTGGVGSCHSSWSSIECWHLK